MVRDLPAAGHDTARRHGCYARAGGPPAPFGVLGLQPMVVFELWLYKDRTRWLVGMDERVAASLPAQFSAQCPGLDFTALDNSDRPQPITGRELRYRSLAYPVRLDVAEGVTAALLTHHAKLHPDEAAVVQWVVGPSQYLTDYPVQQTPLDFLGFAAARAGRQR